MVMVSWSASLAAFVYYRKRRKRKQGKVVPSPARTPEPMKFERTPSPPLAGVQPVNSLDVDLETSNRGQEVRDPASLSVA